MKLLLDENVPTRLKRDLVDHVVSSVVDEGWRFIKNGELLQLMIASGFHALITLDQSIKYQQNFRKYPIPVIVLQPQSAEYREVQLLMPDLNKL
jgi:hypothetical protein